MLSVCSTAPCAVHQTLEIATAVSLPTHARRSVAARWVNFSGGANVRNERAVKAAAVSPMWLCTGITVDVIKVVRLLSLITSNFTTAIFRSARSLINEPASCSVICPFMGRNVKSSAGCPFTLIKHRKGVLVEMVNASHSSGKVNDGIDESNCIPYATFFCLIERQPPRIPRRAPAPTKYQCPTMVLVFLSVVPSPSVRARPQELPFLFAKRCQFECASVL